jgi:glutathione S-transferase
VITDGGRTIHESGAIIDYLVRRYGSGRLQPAPGSDAYDDYVQWLHYAEGSAMTPLLLDMYVRRLGEAGAALQPRIESELANHFGFVNAALEGRDWLLGSEFSAADIQMGFVAEAAGMFGKLPAYPAIRAWLDRFRARPAYRAAMEKGGLSIFGPQK